MQVSIIIFFLFSTFFPIVIFSQKYNEGIQIVKRGQKYYYVHTVRKGEELEEIAKMYNIELDDIVYENSFLLKRKLKENDTLYLPISSIKTEYIKHVVKKGETLYGIAKRYGVAIEEIIQANPFVYRGLKEGDILNIPKRILPSYDFSLKERKNLSDSLKDKDVFYYKVKKGDTVYRICKENNLTEENFYKLNPEVKKNGLKYGQIVVIGVREKKKDLEKKEINNSLLFPKIDSIKEEHFSEKNIFCNKFKNQDIIKICFLINLEEIENDLEKIENKTVITQSEISKSLNKLSFINGFFLACDSMLSRKINIDVSFMSKLPSNIEEYDVIINLLENFYLEETIKIKRPIFCLKKPLKCNENCFYLFSTFPSKIIQLSKYLSDFDSLYFISLYTDSVSLNYVNLFSSNLQNSKNNIFDLKKLIHLEKILHPNLINIIFVPIYSEINVIDLLNKLNLLTKKYRIVLIYYPGWNEFIDDIDLEQLFNLNTIMFENYRIDFSSKEVQKFINRYQNSYKNFPDIYSFIGYDVGIFLINKIHQYGKDFFTYLNEIEVPILTSLPYFKNFENIGIVISYFDNSQKKVIIMDYFSSKRYYKKIFPSIQVRK